MDLRTTPEHILAAHQLYCRLTGQQVRLGYDRERQWYELLRQGFSLEDVRRVILYLQREIRHGRRNVGALKLSNLLQPDRFEEDLNIGRLHLQPPRRPAANPSALPLSEEERERQRKRCLEQIRQLRESLRLPPTN
jgi:hypothetical protein